MNLGKDGRVYILTNRPNGIFYIGLTADLVRRPFEHREGLVEGFTKRHGLTRLVWFERHKEIAVAIAREKAIKHWKRAQKVRLIMKQNYNWVDLYNGFCEGFRK